MFHKEVLETYYLPLNVLVNSYMWREKNLGDVVNWSWGAGRSPVQGEWKALESHRAQHLFQVSKWHFQLRGKS